LATEGTRKKAPEVDIEQELQQQRTWGCRTIRSDNDSRATRVHKVQGVRLFAAEGKTSQKGTSHMYIPVPGMGLGVD
jgi:hypothetical protein